MGVKDYALSEYLKDTSRFADLINGTIFQGYPIIDSRYLKKLQRKKRLCLNSYEAITTPDKDAPKYTPDKLTFVKPDFVERERDMLMLHDKPDKRFLVGCEGQSTADYNMPLRNMVYDGIEYTDQLKTKEYQSISQDGTVYPLIPVFNVILYMGETRWKAKHSLHDMMNVPKEVEKFRTILPDYRIHVADIREQNPQLFHTEWKDIFQLMKHSRKKEDLKAYIETHERDIQKLSTETRRFLAVLLDQYIVLENNRLEVKDMCQAWDGAMMMYREEGKAEGKRELTVNLIRDGLLSITEGAKYLNMNEADLKKHI